MGGWRSRFVFLFIVYFAGFATAIYCLTPVPDNRGGRPAEKTFAYSALKSDEFAKSFNEEIRKCIDVGKDVALRTSKFIKQKFDERKTDG